MIELSCCLEKQTNIHEHCFCILWASPETDIKMDKRKHHFFGNMRLYLSKEVRRIFRGDTFLTHIKTI